MIDFVKDFWSDGWIGRAVLIGIALVVIALPFGIYFAAKEHAQWTAWCQSQGGHVVDHTTSSPTVSYDSKGQPVVGTTTDTTYYCLNEEGGIIDIK